MCSNFTFTFYIYSKAMRGLLFVIVILLSACQNQKNKEAAAKQIAAVSNPAAEKIKSHVTADSITIAAAEFGSLSYAKQDFYNIVDNFPALYQPVAVHPDIAYTQSGHAKDFIDAAGEKKQLGFEGDKGQDDYYLLYAYFLKQQNQAPDLEIRRQNISAIYNTINDFFSALNSGGDYFGHQKKRIGAYTEYSVYQFSKMKDFLKIQYTINEQKNAYLKTLRNLIVNEIKESTEITGKNTGLIRQKELLELLTKIDHLITDDFYLKKAQEFQRTCY